MNRRSKPLFAAIAAAAALFASSSSFASGLAVCNGCTLMQTNAAARAKAPGYVYVVDTQTPRLRLFHTEKAANGMVSIEPMPVPQQVQHYFAEINGAIDAGETQETVVVIEDGQGWPGDYYGTDPLTGFENQGYDAYDVVLNATLRNRLEESLGNWSHTGNSTLDFMTELLIGYLGDVVQYILGEPIVHIIEIRWDDGSVTRFRIDSSHASTADYIEGESRDRDGNLIPDASATTPGGAERFAGDHEFSSVDDAADWLAAAMMYGIRVSGPETPTKPRMQCKWDYVAARLTCWYQ